MNIGKFCPLSLCNLIRNFCIYLYIVSLVVILSNWVCDNWVYRFPAKHVVVILVQDTLVAAAALVSTPTRNHG